MTVMILGCVRWQMVQKTEDRRIFGKKLRPIGRNFFLPGALFPNLCAPSQFLFLYFCPLVAKFCKTTLFLTSCFCQLLNNFGYITFWSCIFICSFTFIGLRGKSVFLTAQSAPLLVGTRIYFVIS